MRVYALLAVAALTASCGNSPAPLSPTGPTPTPTPTPAPGPTVPQMAGAWTGPLEMTFQGRRFHVDTRAELRQSDRAISGTWEITTPGNDSRGEIAGTLDGIGAETTFSGTVTWTASPETGAGRCVGQSSFRGAVGDARLRWEAPSVNWGGTCSDPPERLVWTLTR